jgi:hypothetical protein
MLKLQLKEWLREKQKKQDQEIIMKSPPSHQSEPYGDRQNTTRKKNSKEVDRFIQVFVTPVFHLVSANWTCLVVRRSFDLDLLEWRSSNCLRSTTVEEIKSRRVAITQHQRDINASIDVLHSLAWSEHSDLDCHESLPSINLGRPNGFIAENEDRDSW